MKHICFLTFHYINQNIDFIVSVPSYKNPFYKRIDSITLIKFLLLLRLAIEMFSEFFTTQNIFFAWTWLYGLLLYIHLYRALFMLCFLPL